MLYNLAMRKNSTKQCLNLEVYYKKMLSISKSELENSKEGTQLYDNYIEYKKILDSFTLVQDTILYSSE